MASHGADEGRLKTLKTARNCRAMLLQCVLAALILPLAGCVHGVGCLLEEPIKHTLTGRINFRTFPTPAGLDHVPVLVLDRTAYVYAPAHGYSCLYATEMQLAGIAEFPESVIENSHVSVEGSIFEATADHEHTRFLVNVRTLLPIAENVLQSGRETQQSGHDTKQP